MNENKEKEYSPIYMIICKLCKKSGISATKLCSDLTGSKGNLPTWQKGNIKAITLIKMADYFDCSVDYLLGRADKPNPEIKEVKDTNNTGGVHVFDFTVPAMNPTANEQQQEIAEMLSEMTPRQKNQLMTIIYDFYDECKKQSPIE